MTTTLQRTSRKGRSRNGFSEAMTENALKRIISPSNAHSVNVVRKNPRVNVRIMLCSGQVWKRPLRLLTYMTVRIELSGNVTLFVNSNERPVTTFVRHRRNLMLLSGLH